MEEEQERRERLRRRQESINHPMPIHARDLADKQSLWLVLLCNQTQFDSLFHN